MFPVPPAKQSKIVRDQEFTSYKEVPRFHAGVRAQVREAIEVALTPRVTDRDLRGYRSAEPGWIADRISCLSVAVEIRRMIMGSEPAFERVRTVLEDDESAKQLVWECWGHMRRNHS